MLCCSNQVTVRVVQVHAGVKGNRYEIPFSDTEGCDKVCAMVQASPCPPTHACTHRKPKSEQHTAPMTSLETLHANLLHIC